MHDCCGKIDDGLFFSKRPFVVLDWPAKDVSFSFETAGEAKHFITDVCKLPDSATPTVRLYGFVSGEWKPLSKPVLVTPAGESTQG
jgi:hypothetical protein